MPAPAVIPAPIAYVNVVAVKTLVVGAVRLEEKMLMLSKDDVGTPPIHWIVHVHGFACDYCPSTFTLRKSECS